MNKGTLTNVQMASIERLAALAHMRQGAFALAIETAQFGIHSGDEYERCLGSLIQSVSHGRMGRLDEANAVYRQALLAWPDALTRRGCVVEADHGVLVIKSAALLEDLKAEADALLGT